MRSPRNSARSEYVHSASRICADELAADELGPANTIVNRLLRFRDLTGLDVTIPVHSARAHRHRSPSSPPAVSAPGKTRWSPSGTVNLSNPRAIFAGSPPRFTRSRVTYEAYVVSRTSTRPQVDSAVWWPSADHMVRSQQDRAVTDDRPGPEKLDRRLFADREQRHNRVAGIPVTVAHAVPPSLSPSYATDRIRTPHMREDGPRAESASAAGESSAQRRS